MLGGDPSVMQARREQCDIDAGARQCIEVRRFSDPAADRDRAIGMPPSPCCVQSLAVDSRPRGLTESKPSRVALLASWSKSRLLSTPTREQRSRRLASGQRKTMRSSPNHGP